MKTHVTPLQIQTREIYSCIFSGDGARVLTGAQGNPVQHWEVTSGRCIRSFAHSGPVWALGWGKDEGTFLSADGTLRLWDLETNGCRQTFEGQNARCLAWGSGGRVISGFKRSVHVLDVVTGRCLREMEGHEGDVYCVQLDAEEKRALSGARDGTVRLWDVETGRCLRVIEAHDYHVHAVAWARDQRRAVSVSREVRLWDIESGECLRTLQGHEDTIRSIQWSADERQVLTGAHDGTVRLWDVEEGDCVRVLKGHGTGVVKAVFSADEERVFSCDWDGEVRVWEIR